MMKRIFTKTLVTLLILSAAAYGSISAYMLLFNNKISNYLVCRGLVLDETKTYLFTNTPTICGTDTVIITVQNKLMPESLGILTHHVSSRWKFITSGEIINPQEDRSNPFLPWCVERSNRFLREARYFANDSINEDVLLKGIKFNRPGGDKQNDRFVIRLSKNQEQTLLNTRSEGLGVAYPIFNTLDTNFYEVNFGAIPFDTNALSNKIFSFPANFGVDNAHFMVCISTRGGDGCHIIIKNSLGETVVNVEGRKFRIGNIEFVIQNQLPIWLIISVLIYVMLLLSFQFILLKRFYLSPNPFHTSIVAFQLSCNSFLLLGIPLFILALQQDSGRLFIIPLAVLLNLNLYYYLKGLTNFHLLASLWNFMKKYSILIFCALFCIGFISLFFAANEAIGGIPILHVAKALILILLVLIQTKHVLLTEIRKKHSRNYALRVLFANIENLVIIAFSIVISVITHDIGSLVFTISAIIIISLLSNWKLSLVPILVLISIIVVVILSISLVDSSFLDQHRKLYRIVSFLDIPSHFNGANESDKETASDHYYLLKHKWENPKPAITDTIIPTNWRTVFFSDYAVLWSFLIGGWIFLFIAGGTLLFLLYHSIRLIFFALKVFKTDANTVFYFPITKSKVVVFLLAVSLIQFIYPFLSNFLCLPLTGQSVPALSASKVEVLFLIILVIALQFLYNQSDYYMPADRFSLQHKIKSYVALKKSVLVFTLVIVGCLVFANIASRARLRNIENSMNWPIYYTTVNDSLGPLTGKEKLIRLAQNYIGEDAYTEVPREKQEYLRNLSSYFFYNKPYNKLSYRQTQFYNSVSEVGIKTSVDSAATIRKYPIDHEGVQLGYSVKKFNNGKPMVIITNKYLSGYPIGAESVDIDLQASLNKILESFVPQTGITNMGTVIVSDNATGGILSSASYPFFCNSTPAVVEQFNANNTHGIRLISNGDQINFAETYLLPGSIVKPIIAYASLQCIDDIESQIYNGVNFNDFLKNSDDQYSAEVFKRLMRNPLALDQAIREDFDLPLYSSQTDALIDAWPKAEDFDKELDKKNPLYRLSIGQQQTFTFRKMVEIYSRIASGLKVTLNYDTIYQQYAPLSLNRDKLLVLHQAMHGALYGTATLVRQALEAANIDYSGFICKTGTAQKRGGKGNATSSFILCTERYTIGIQLAGDIPENSAGLSAKSLFVKIIPLLKAKDILVEGR